MMPNATLASYTRTMHNNLASQELRRYARDEWRSQVHWIHASAQRVSLRLRVQRWIRRGRMRKEAIPPAGSSSPSTAATAAVPIDFAAPCLHPAQEELGLSGAATFLRCCVCGEVLVVSRGRAWGLRRTEPLDVSAPSSP